MEKRVVRGDNQSILQAGACAMSPRLPVSRFMSKKHLIAVVLLLQAMAVIHAQPPPPEIHCKHFLHGYPLGTPASNDLIIRDIYALSNNDNTKFADWVCYRITMREVDHTLTVERKWAADPWLDDDETLEPNDYKGASNALGTDRGHQAPLASFKGTLYGHETNYLSNITPQRKALNQGPWMRLEKRVRDIVREGTTVYVMTGPLYEIEQRKLPQAEEDHRIPSAYWKIVAVPGTSNVLDIAAFIMPQDAERNDPILDFLVSVDEVERRSSLEFFRELTTDRQQQLEAGANTAWASERFAE